MKFLVDNQLPPALAEFLRLCGHDCDHVHDLKLDKARDVELWSRVLQKGRIVVSEDDDFLYLASRPDDNGRLERFTSFSSVRIRNARKSLWRRWR